MVSFECSQGVRSESPARKTYQYAVVHFLLGATHFNVLLFLDIRGASCEDILERVSLELITIPRYGLSLSLADAPLYTVRK